MFGFGIKTYLTFLIYVHQLPRYLSHSVDLLAEELRIEHVKPRISCPVGSHYAHQRAALKIPLEARNTTPIPDSLPLSMYARPFNAFKESTGQLVIPDRIYAGFNEEFVVC